MAVERCSIAFDPDLFRAVRDAADEEEEALSAWMAEAARQRLRAMALDDSVPELLADTGLTEEQALAADAEAEASAIRSTGSLAPDRSNKPAAASRRRSPATTKTRAKTSAKTAGPLKAG